MTISNLDKSLEQAYEYFKNVVIKQRRFLDVDDMITGYRSMHFKNPLSDDHCKILLDEMKQALINLKGE